MDNIVEANSMEQKKEEVGSKDICPKCGTPFEGENKFCTNCGTARPIRESYTRHCTNCGAAVMEGHAFCPKCGATLQVIPTGMPFDNLSINQFNQVISEKQKKKKRFSKIALICFLAVLVAGYFFGKPYLVSDIDLTKASIELRVDKTETAFYKVEPEKASDFWHVKWSTSDSKVATVDKNGIIKGVGEGSCTITASVGWKKDSLTVIVKSGPDLKDIYNTYCKSGWATLASDESYLMIDTNPWDFDDYTDTDAYYAIKKINDALGLSASVFEKMGQTRAIDGRQTKSFDGGAVSWTYHPDNGLEVLYELDL